jgi:hypothetical protein
MPDRLREEDRRLCFAEAAMRAEPLAQAGETVALPLVQ